jgi:class 3 adenylate cyclase
MAMGHYDDAERHLTTAIEANRRMGVHGWADLAARQYVWLLMARNGDGDREKALALANELLELGRQIGMPPLVDAALAAKIELQGLKKIDVGSSLYAVASAVHVEQPDLRTHAAPDGTVTIMFSDIEGSTAMAERLGDERWLDLLHVHNDLVRTAVAEQQGYEVKAVGDGFMVAFASARRALRCAVAVQQALDKHNADHPDQPISVRIGIHTGEVIAEADDFFGRNVILASRVAAKANGGEVLVSSLVRDLVAGASEFAFDEGRSVDLKGLADAQTVHALRWR